MVELEFECKSDVGFSSQVSPGGLDQLESEWVLRDDQPSIKKEEKEIY